MKISNIALALLFMVSSAHAQLYKWVAPDGTVSYSDKQPPASATKVERKAYTSAPSLGDMPYEVAQAAKANPVTLYTMQKCAACDQGRTLLTTRGIPFSEKTVSSNEDIERVQKLSGGSQMPLLIIGKNKQTGFESGQWGSALTAAGYPATNTLPKSYSNPAPEPAAPPAKAVEAATPKKDDAPPTLAQPLPAAGNAPPGFQF
ncbi:MAG TPA: glutaredoxin family protein [Burkholderiaceae bacterium]|jgi:glutaredoxin|nr:glutaredoxin family protein [Burkholderiaceae bacterium]